MLQNYTLYQMFRSQGITNKVWRQGRGVQLRMLLANINNIYKHLWSRATLDVQKNKFHFYTLYT